MSRDHSKLRVFADAHQLTLDIYRNTKNFPKDEWFGMRVQLRRLPYRCRRTSLKEMRARQPPTISIFSTSLLARRGS